LSSVDVPLDVCAEMGNARSPAADAAAIAVRRENFSRIMEIS
jgi:hypothetical protein